MLQCEGHFTHGASKLKKPGHIIFMFVFNCARNFFEEQSFEY